MKDYKNIDGAKYEEALGYYNKYSNQLGIKKEKTVTTIGPSNH